jgi:hypothetical protein
MKTHQDLTVDELRKLFYVTAIVGSQEGFYTEEEAISACNIFEVFAKTLRNPSLIELGLETVRDTELEDIFN